MHIADGDVDIECGAGRDLRNHHMVDRQHQLAAKVGEQLFGQINLVFFHQ